jgi:serine/threonine protein kinase
MGSRLGDRYQLLHPVRGDRFGMTHIARGPDGGPAAVRVLPPGLARDPAVVHRAVADRDLLTGVRHPNLATVHDVLVDDGVAIAARAVLGTPLRRWRRPLPVSTLREIGAGVADGLRALHRHGVCHGTLSPSTVVVTRDGEVVLTDIALGHLMGTASAEADVVALGEVLTAVWRSTNPPWRRRPADVWADTMARARDMG